MGSNNHFHLEMPGFRTARLTMEMSQIGKMKKISLIVTGCGIVNDLCAPEKTKNPENALILGFCALHPCGLGSIFGGSKSILGVLYVGT